MDRDSSRCVSLHMVDHGGPKRGVKTGVPNRMEMERGWICGRWEVGGVIQVKRQLVADVTLLRQDSQPIVQQDLLLRFTHRLDAN